MLNGDGMFLMAVGVMKWLEVVGAFTLEPYRVHKHPWRVNKVGQGDRKWLSDSVVDSRFNQSARVAWIPRGSDATSEAVLLHRSFWGVNGTLEFVHVHKCGGLTFNHVVPGWQKGDSLLLTFLERGSSW